MYNRYIPQPDGSYRRNSIHEPPKAPDLPQTPPAPAPEPPPQSANCAACPNRPSARPQPARNSRPPAQSAGVLTFLKQLLPRDFDTEDLLVILLLLLIAGDCNEDRNSALLTLALYLFL